MISFPEREQRHHSDIFPGMTFYFVENPNSPGLLDTLEQDFDLNVPWTVITKDFTTKMSGGYWKFLLLDPGPTLKWHDGGLGWIRRVADPVWEERAANDWGHLHEGHHAISRQVTYC